MINTVTVQNLLAHSVVSMGMAVSSAWWFWQEAIYFSCTLNKNKLKISTEQRYLDICESRSGYSVDGYPMYRASDVFLQVSGINIKMKIKKNYTGTQRFYFQFRHIIF